MSVGPGPGHRPRRRRAGGPPTTPSSRRGTPSRSRWPPRSTRSRARPTRSTAGGAGPTRSTRRSTTTASTGPRSTPMQEAVVDSLADFARYLRAKARAARPRRRALPVVGPARAGRLRAAGSSGPRPPTRSRDAFATYSPRLAGLVDRAVADGVARRRAPRRQGRRRLLHGGRGRGEPGAAQLRRQLRQRADAGPRARPRLPQHQPRPSHAAAAPDADGAGRDGAASSARRSWSRPVWRRPATTPGRGSRCSTATWPGANQVVVDIHSRFLFERALSAERARRRAVGRPAPRADAPRRRHDAYGDGLDHGHLPPRHVGGEGPLLHRLLQLARTRFGLLFGIGLYAEFQRDPDRFRLGYDDLLSATGLGEAAELAARFGIDVRDSRLLGRQPRRPPRPHRRVRVPRRRRLTQRTTGAASEHPTCGSTSARASADGRDARMRADGRGRSGVSCSTAEHVDDADHRRRRDGGRRRTAGGGS